MQINKNYRYEAGSVDDLQDIVFQAIDEVSEELREISLKIHDKPELAKEERFAHELLVNYLKKKGFKVTPSAYGIETAFVAEFQSKTGEGRVVSFNSEYDALPEIGHACGHNLIAISGVGAAIGLKAVLEKFEIEGTVKLFGTPAEEIGVGKIELIEAGAYKDVNVSLMIHPGAFGGAFGKHIANNSIEVEYFGKSAHASGAPWEGINALDAIILAYNNIGLLRQQSLPTNRVHGIITNGGTAPNVIPDYTSGKFKVRGMTIEDLRSFGPRVQKCFEGAAEATGAKLKTKWSKEIYDLKTNSSMATRYETYDSQKFGTKFPSREQQQSSTSFTPSTDQGNVTHIVPGIQPVYNIFEMSSGINNHTPKFAEQARTKFAHEKTIEATKSVALVGLDILIDDKFYREVRKCFET
ncbi:amidohydrolase [Gigaspora margarita]|uniref:Peptidase M20 domain-containing protein 2 n=1 Tax=Gigaspora margarita TaxID=4874 RepID=A0A8H3ZZM8_GIGMA|nr:amidohydrolase [Gigaspora margarita]